MDLEAGEQIFFKKGKLGKKLLLNYKNSRGFEPIFFHPPTQVEVDRFPSGSITLDKDSVGVHEQYGGFFSVFIYMNLALDVNGYSATEENAVTVPLHIRGPILSDHF